jgi:hypothetical protein
VTHPNALQTLNTKRGGKGRVSPRESKLARATSAECNVVIPTGKRSPYPPYYHVDVAFQERMVAVEIDGPSHRSGWVREADKRKDRLLRALGWSVIRVSNDDVDFRLPDVLRTIRIALAGRAQAAVLQ